MATCKQPFVHPFPMSQCLHMIIDSIKRGPSIASRHLDLHLYSRCDVVRLKQWNLSLAGGGERGGGESFDKAAVIHFNFLIGPKCLLRIGPLKETQIRAISYARSWNKDGGGSERTLRGQRTASRPRGENLRGRKEGSEKDGVNERVRQWDGRVGSPKEQMSLMLSSTGSSQGARLIIL